MGIQINGQTDIISATDGSLTISGATLPTAEVTNLNATGIVTATSFSGPLTGNVTGNLTGTASTATAAATAYGLSGSPTLSGITSVSTTNLTVNGNAYPSDGSLSGARNRIINGDMKIFQRETATTIGASSVYALDRWLFGREAGTESARFTVTSESLTSSDTPFTSDGLRKTMKVDITTASGGISAAQSNYIMQRIEGFNVSDLVYGTSSAKSCTVSFWLKTDVKTGQMGVALYNGGNRYYVQNINANTSWTKYTLVFPGDTGGSIADDNTQQLTLIFTLSSGSNLQGGANSWTGNFRNSTSGQADFTDSTSNNIYLTGVQLEAGTVATPFERRSYGQELALCQRYYYRVNRDISSGRLSSSGFAYASNGAVAVTPFPVQMRTVPTNVEQSGTASHYTLFNSVGSGVVCNAVPSYNIAGLWYGETAFSVSSGLTAGNSTYATGANAAASLAWSAEL